MKINKDSLYKSTFYTALGSLSNIAGNIISISILARVFSETDYGVYSVILVTIGLFEIFAGFGLENGIVKFVADSKIEVNQILSASILIRSLSLAVVSTIFLIMNQLFPNILGIAVNGLDLFIILIAIITLQRDTLLKVLQGLLDFKILAYNQSITAITRLLSIIILISITKINISEMMYVELVIPFISSVFLLGNLIKRHQLTFVVPRIDAIKEIISFSFPLYFNNFFNFFYGRINVLILANKLSPMSAAYYDLSSKVPDAMKRVFDSYITVFFPRQVKDYSKNDFNKISSTLDRSIILFSFLFMVAITLYSLFDTFIVTILFSSKYISITTGLGILLISLSLRVTANLKGYTIVATGNSKVSMYTNLISTFFGLIVVLTSIGSLGFLGAALGVLCMNLIADFIYSIYLIKIKISFNKKILFPVFSYFIFLAFVSKIFVNDFFMHNYIIVISLLLFSWYWRSQLISEMRNLFNQLKSSNIFNSIFKRVK